MYICSLCYFEQIPQSQIHFNSKTKVAALQLSFVYLYSIPQPRATDTNFTVSICSCYTDTILLCSQLYSSEYHPHQHRLRMSVT
jgi:hypothetical protein